jgi:PipA/GogA/GtgA family effector protease
LIQLIKEIEMNPTPPVNSGRASRSPSPSGATANGSLTPLDQIVVAEYALAERFPDLRPQVDHPSLERVGYDQLATDSRPCIMLRQLLDRFIEGRGSMDPERVIRDDVFDRVLPHLQDVLFRAYSCSPTFRRLFNFAAVTHLLDSRWLLAAGEAFGTTVTEAQRAAAGDRLVIALNCDPFEPGHDPGVYAHAGGVHPFSADRLYMQEIVRALTMTRIAEREDHPRGAVIEYVNLILKETGEDSPAQIGHAEPSLPQEGVEEVEFDAIDFGDAFEEPERRAVRSAAQEALDETKDRDAPGAA